MSSAQERSISLSTRGIFKIIVTVLLLGFILAVRDIVALVFSALILAALMNPFALWVGKYRIPKGIAVLVFYLIFFGGATVTLFMALPTVIEQVTKVGTTLGASWHVLTDGVEAVRQFGEQYGLTENLQAGAESLQEQVTNIATGIFSRLTSLFGGLAALIVVLVMAFYMVVREEESLQWFQNFLPDRHQKFVAHVLSEMQSKFGHWLVGQLILSVVVGVLYYIGLRILGVEGALVLAIVGAFTEFIPYLGPILGGIPAVLVAFTQSPVLGLLTILLYILVQQLENHILTPKIIEKAVGLHPVISIVALLVGAKLFGVTGAILAIPVATAGAVALKEILKYQQEKEG
jgi:predicted PurR-regulated permease PerM